MQSYQTMQLARLKEARLTPGSAPCKVLVADDSKSICDLLCACLADIHGVAPVKAGSLQQVRALLAQDATEFMCAVLDLNLPDAPDGEVVDYVRQYGIPIVVLTGSVNPVVREAMLQKQVIDYVIKGNPNEIEHVAYVVGRLYENQAVKILVVDDAKSVRGYLEQLLRHYRYQTLSAADGEAALEILQKHPDIALVITDYYMPGMNGQELIQRLRKHYRREELAIIGLSDATHTGLSAMLLKSGANDFLNKPFEVEEFYCRVTQNTNMIGYVRQIREAAIRDFLTGAYNRRHLFALGEALHANARRGNIHLAAAIIDADHFKRINDQYGHQAGDTALKRIVQTLHANTRKADIIARYGGEEFVCLAVLQEPQQAAALFEKIRAAIADIALNIHTTPVQITASIGVTLSLEADLDSMLQRADKAVYRAKELGRNQVVIL